MTVDKWAPTKTNIEPNIWKEVRPSGLVRYRVEFSGAGTELWSLEESLKDARDIKAAHLKKYPQLIGQTRGGSELSPGMVKIQKKLRELLKGGGKLNISIDELKKKAKAPEVTNDAVSAFIGREKTRGTKFFKNITVTLFATGVPVGESKYDEFYNNSKKFQNFYNKWGKKPWSEIRGTNKSNAYGAFLRDKVKVTKPGFNLTGPEIAKKFGIKYETLKTYLTLGRKDEHSSIKFIRDNVERIKTTVDRKRGDLYKEPSETVLKNWKALRGSSTITSRMVDNIKEFNKKFRDVVIKEKRLPTITEVISKTSIKTPATAAGTVAVYSRLLRGEKFKRVVDVAANENAGKRLIAQLSKNNRQNTYRTAFYQLALDNINKMYGKSGTLGTFKTNFRKELKNILKTKEAPFSINEVIGLSTGESRGVQPFSVFVDAVERNINKGDLANYQSEFSKKLGRIQTLLSGDKPNSTAAGEIASSLDKTRSALVNRLIKKGYTTPQIKQLNLPEIKIGKTIDPNIYSPEKLARWKKAGLDIGQFVKEKGFYIDVKKAKPFWESNVKNTIVEAAKHNIGNVCGIFKGKIAYSADGGRIGFQGGCAGEMTAAMETNAKGTLQQITKTEGILPKFQNAARGFLGMLGRGGLKAAPYAALAAVGAAAEPLVKKFMVDDPTTYLTDENQMKGMLLATIEGEPPKVDEEILKWQYPAAGAAAATAIPGSAAMYKARRLPFKSVKRGIDRAAMGPARAALGPVGKFLAGSFSPLGVAATLPISIAAERKGGTDWGDIATDPGHWMGPAFASAGAEMATKGIKNPLLLKAIRLGMKPSTLRFISSKLGMPGLALTAGMWGYDRWKKARDD